MNFYLKRALKFAGAMGAGVGLGESGRVCAFGTFYLDDLRVFPPPGFGSTPFAPSATLILIGRNRDNHAGVPCRGPFPARSCDLYARRLAGKSSPNDLLYKGQPQRNTSLSLSFPYHKTTTPSTRPHDPPSKSNGESNGNASTHIPHVTPHTQR